MDKIDEPLFHLIDNNFQCFNMCDHQTWNFTFYKSGDLSNSTEDVPLLRWTFQMRQRFEETSTKRNCIHWTYWGQ